MAKRFVHFIAICVILSPVLLTSCEKDYFDPTFTIVSKEASDFDFSTTQNVQMDLTYNVPNGYAVAFDLYEENPVEVKGTEFSMAILKSGIKPIGSGIAVSGKYTNIKQFPGYVKELYAYTSDLFATRLMRATIANGKATFAEEATVATASMKSPSTRNASNGSSDGSFKDNYDPEKKMPNNINEILQRINAAFPNEKHVDPKFYQDASIYLQQKAQVWITPLVTDGALTNELLYFCYKGAKTDLPNLTAAQRANLKMYSVYHDKVTSDISNNKYVKLKYTEDGVTFSDEFPAGTTIGWALRPYHEGNYLGATFYSVPAWNPENSTTVTKNHTIYFDAGTPALPFICFGFEDMRNDKLWNGFGDNDCNDMMFNVQLDPIDATEPPPVIDDPKPIETTQEYKGYLGYEDYWPIFFDYDMNDLLVKYHSTVTSVKTIGGQNPDENVYVKTIVDDFTMVFTGADFHNKFGCIVNIDPAMIDKVILDNREIAGNSLTKEGTGFILDICDDARAVLIAYNYATPPKTYKVRMEFKSKALKMSDFEANQQMAPYNPFITPISDNGLRHGDIEVHLPNYKPTSRVDNRWFGAHDDRSDITNGKYYIGGATRINGNGEFVEKNIFPFAIHLSGIEDFYIPRERVRIDRTYPRFTNWVESDKQQDQDWYKHPDLSIK